MNKNISLPISGPSAWRNSRFKSLKYKPFFEIEKDRKIESKKWVYRIIEFCLRFLIFSFVSLLLFTVFCNAITIFDLDGDSTDDAIRLFDGTTV